MSAKKMSYGEEIGNLQLVKEVEKHPVLYNFKLPDYSKRDMVEAAWNDIAKEMNEEAIVCKEKWRNLRTVFVRKLKPLPTGVMRRKSYYLREAMSFLTPFVKNKTEEPQETAPAQSEAESTEPSEAEPNCSVFDDGDSPIQAVNPEPRVNPKRRPAKRSYAEAIEFADCAERLAGTEAKTTRNLEVDESRRFFLLSLLPEVQRLTDSQMKFFRRKILDTLDEAEALPPANGYLNTETNGDSFYVEFSPKKEI